MAQIRTAKVGDVQSFPGATFVIDNTPPIAQCQETQITFVAADITNGSPVITKPVSFEAIDLAGKTVTVSAPPGSVGTYNIISSTHTSITTDHTFTETSAVCAGTCQDAGQAYLTRNESSFQRFLNSFPFPHTTKGGQVFTSAPNPPLNLACSDTFNPD